MARPQIKDGHTKIANELMDALMRTNFSSYERRILDCILRKTYGWNKKSDRISYTQFQESTGLAHQHVGRTLKLLRARNIIFCQGEGQNLEYSIQKDYEQWIELRNNHQKPVPNGVLVNPDVTSTERGTGELPSNQYLTGTQPVPNGDEPVPNGVLKPVPNGVHTKAIKHYTKALYKSIVGKKQSFEEYRDSLKEKYLDVNFDHEVEKFWLYWDGHDKKHTVSNSKLALVNWMDKARKFKQESKANERGIRENRQGIRETRAERDEHIRRSIGAPLI